MQVYKQEILDGLEHSIRSNASTAICSILKSYEAQVGDDEKLQKVIAQYSPSNPNQIDLHYINCVLVSDGWNKNDDVFDRQELWAARNTPEDKPFNYMHDESDIIGHITGSILVDQEGNEISDDIDFSTLPENFDIITSAVIYKAWSDQEQSARVKQLVEEIDNGDWSVSMECLFSNFDYALIKEDGSHIVLPRTEASAFLTKHLRAYGGNGEYEGNKVGRLLRNISFSGIGLVNKPANPRSVILDNNVEPFHKKGDEMSQETLAKTAASEEAVDFVAKEKELTDTIASLREELASKEAKIVELTSNLTTANEDVNSTQEQLAAMKKEIAQMKRKASLSDAGVESDQIESVLKAMENCDDEAFNSMLSFLAEAAKKKMPMMDEKEDKEETMSKKAKCEETEEVDEVVETEVEIVAEEAAASLVDAGHVEDDSVQKAKASLGEWLTKNVFTSTRNLA